jgi:hypothetical protein
MVALEAVDRPARLLGLIGEGVVGAAEPDVGAGAKLVVAQVGEDWTVPDLVDSRS